jgi:hypothetical protein
VRCHKDEDVLQEDILVIDGQAKETCCGGPSQEEQDWLEDSPFAGLVNLGY